MAKKVWNILLALLILFNSGVFLLYGVAKLAGWQFTHHEPPPTLLAKDISPLAVMWYFFGLKKGYAILVGLGEIIPALLILFRRTRLLGILIYLFTAINVLAINIFFDITPATLGLSIILFANSLIILYSEKQKLGSLLSLPQQTP